MSALAALEGMARCMRAIPSIGTDVRVHARRSRAGTIQPGCEVSFGDQVAVWDMPTHDTYAVGVVAVIYIPAVDYPKAQDKLGKVVHDLSIFRIRDAQRSNTLDDAPGIIQCRWAGIGVEDATGTDGKAVIAAVVQVAATVQLGPEDVLP